MNEIAFYCIIFSLMILAIAGGWCVPPWILLKLTGYNRLSEKYPETSEFAGRWLPYTAMIIGSNPAFPVSWLSIGLSTDSIRLRLARFICPFHKRTQIPWSEVASVEPTKIRQDNFLVLRLNDGNKITIHDGKGILNEELRKQLTMAGIERLSIGLIQRSV